MRSAPRRVLGSFVYSSSCSDVKISIKELPRIAFDDFIFYLFFVFVFSLGREKSETR